MIAESTIKTQKRDGIFKIGHSVILMQNTEIGFCFYSN
jgi:hypothetical protein